MIYVDIGLSRLLPVSVMGAGFFHVLKIALSLAEVDRGLVLIDELEDGLHYLTFPKLIGTMLETVSQKWDVQIFVTTHSRELIDAALAVINEKGFEDFCLINLVPSKEGMTILPRVKTLWGSQGSWDVEVTYVDGSKEVLPTAHRLFWKVDQTGPYYQRGPADLSWERLPAKR